MTELRTQARNYLEALEHYETAHRHFSGMPAATPAEALREQQMNVCQLRAQVFAEGAHLAALVMDQEGGE
jgi:hypothetical protein